MHEPQRCFRCNLPPRVFSRHTATPCSAVAQVQVLQQTPPNYTETKRVRAVKIYSERIFEVCTGDAPIADIDTTYWQLRIEPVPADDVEAEQRCAAAAAEPVLALFSHSKEVEGATDGQLEDYGDPLALIVHPDDTLAQARDRCAPAVADGVF